MAVVEAPTIKAPRGATRVFTRRVASALISVIGVVTLILMLAERWPVYDALYFTTTTLATIGFGDLRPITKVGRAVTSLLGLSGVGLLGGLVSAVVGEWEKSSAEDLQEKPPAPAASRWAWVQSWEKGWAWLRASRPGLFAALELVRVSGLLLAVGVGGFKLCEVRRSWQEAAYLVVGVMSTAGLGDVVTRALPPEHRSVSASSCLATSPPLSVVPRPMPHPCAPPSPGAARRLLQAIPRRVRPPRRAPLRAGRERTRAAAARGGQGPRATGRAPPVR